VYRKHPILVPILYAIHTRNDSVSVWRLAATFEHLAGVGYRVLPDCLCYSLSCNPARAGTCHCSGNPVSRSRGNDDDCGYQVSLTR